MGVASGRWMENEQARPDIVSKQIAFITNLAAKHDCRLVFDESLAGDDCADVISQEDFWDLNITWDNHSSADRISYGMYRDLENFLKAKLRHEISNQ